jgi:hypothetical protein
VLGHGRDGREPQEPQARCGPRLARARALRRRGKHPRTRVSKMSTIIELAEKKGLDLMQALCPLTRGAASLVSWTARRRRISARLVQQRRRLVQQPRAWPEPPPQICTPAPLARLMRQRPSRQRRSRQARLRGRRRRRRARRCCCSGRPAAESDWRLPHPRFCRGIAPRPGRLRAQSRSRTRHQLS